MRLFVIVTWLSLLVVVPLHAQTSTNGAQPVKPIPGAGEPQALAILTPDQQVEYAQAHEKALADNPVLKAENDALKQRYLNVMTTGTSAEKQAMMERVDSHRQKLRQAMLKEDPKLGPIFAQIDKYISEAKAKGAPAGN
jgi:hypothetical protein